MYLSNKLDELRKKVNFCCHLESLLRKEQDTDPGPDLDLDPLWNVRIKKHQLQKITYPDHWFLAIFRLRI
jgi:hypothetical protein